MGDSRFLFVHFIGESENGEQIYFSASEDGLHWNDLNGGEPVLISNLGENGVRDPFIVRDPESGQYHIIATDLRIANGKGWGVAQFGGSRYVAVWDSDDLVNWSEERLIEIGIPEAGCVWAPEAVYYEPEKSFFVFWASMVKEEGDTDAKQRIYASFTKDFKTFTKPFKYIEMKDHIIDTTIVKEGNWYYRISKNESTKNIKITKCEDLIKGPFIDVHSESIESIMGVEGPEAYFIEDINKWCLIVDRFAEGKGYMPLLADSLAKAEFTPVPEGKYDMGKNQKRHGGVIAISKEEYERLLKEM